MTEMIWRDGALIPFADATMHVLGHAAHRGSEVFDVLRVVPSPDGPAAIGLRAHIARFDRSMELMHMDSPYDVAAIERAVADTVLANPGSAVVKVVAAWTEIALTSRPTSLVPSIYVAALTDGGDPVGPPTPIDAVTGTMPKIPPAVLPPGLKVAASYTPALRQQIAADRDGRGEVVFRTLDGNLAEATTQSALVVLGETLAVPPLDQVLDGITRRLLLDVATDAGITVEVRDIAWNDVEAADELILSSTNRFLTPIGSLDGRTLAAPGPVTTRLTDTARAIIGGDHALAERWLTPLSPLASP